MTESIWVLRDPSGAITGASKAVIGGGRRLAMRNAIGDQWESFEVGEDFNRLILADPKATRYAFEGYTLALEPHARPEGVADV